MTSVTALTDEIKRRVWLQRTTGEFTDEEYLALIVYGIKRLFIDTGRALLYKNYQYVSTTDADDTAVVPADPGEPDDGEAVEPPVDADDDETPAKTDEILFTYDLDLDEEEYVLLIAEMQFLQIIQKDVNTITSYTTNALSVTGADKPYAHLADSLEKLEAYRRELNYTMIRYMTGVSC